MIVMYVYSKYMYWRKTFAPSRILMSYISMGMNAIIISEYCVIVAYYLTVKGHHLMPHSDYELSHNGK